MAVKILYVAIGGSLGAVCRYGLSTWIHHKLGMAFPYGTMAANVIGCLLIGFLLTYHREQLGIDSHLYGLVVIGFLGAFTTFSTFTHETWRFFESGALFHAGLNIVVSLLACFVGLALGIATAKLAAGTFTS